MKERMTFKKLDFPNSEINKNKDFISTVFSKPSIDSILEELK